MARNNVLRFTKKKAKGTLRSNYRRIIGRSVLPMSLAVAVAGPAMLLALPTGGFLPFLLLMANDLFGAAIGAILFLLYPKTRTSVLSLEPDVPCEANDPVKRAA